VRYQLNISVCFLNLAARWKCSISGTGHFTPDDCVPSCFWHSGSHSRSGRL